MARGAGRISAGLLSGLGNVLDHCGIVVFGRTQINPRPVAHLHGDGVDPEFLVATWFKARGFLCWLVVILDPVFDLDAGATSFQRVFYDQLSFFHVDPQKKKPRTWRGKDLGEKHTAGGCCGCDPHRAPG